MSEFVRRWASWGAADAAQPSTVEPGPVTSKTRQQPTDKTDKSSPVEPETGSQPTDKTDKRAFGSSVSSLPARSQGIAAPSTATGDDDQVPTPEDVEAMALSEFAQAGLIVRLATAEAWGADVLIVSDDVPEAEARAAGLPVYRAAELRKIHFLKPKPHEMRLLNDLKTIIGVTIESVEVGGARR